MQMGLGIEWDGSIDICYSGFKLKLMFFFLIGLIVCWESLGIERVGWSGFKSNFSMIVKRKLILELERFGLRDRTPWGRIRIWLVSCSTNGLFCSRIGIELEKKKEFTIRVLILSTNSQFLPILELSNFLWRRTIFHFEYLQFQNFDSFYPVSN